MLYSLPTEIKLYIFKFLNYQDLCSMKQTNLHFRDFIVKFEEELAREKFYKISIEYLNQSKQVPHKLIKLKVGNFDFSLKNKQLEEKWENGLENPILLFLPRDLNNVICLNKGRIFI
uniref:F-box domain-containing protein n=1 Tax=Meloidogyne enterolobii TaxID=390850 RepID=A0A6V7WRD0_MELEN|nr:unnamed protein product [Meloidogyne enterolobii]